MSAALNEWPDPGAYIEVQTKSGAKHEGFIDPGHAHIGAGFLCLRKDPAPDDETRFTYIRTSEIESWVWDCSP